MTAAVPDRISNCTNLFQPEPKRTTHADPCIIRFPKKLQCIRVFNWTRLWQRVPSRIPVSTPSTKDHRYHHAILPGPVQQAWENYTALVMTAADVSGGDVCCLLTAGDHPWTAIEKLISFTQRLHWRTYASVSKDSKSGNRASVTLHVGRSHEEQRKCLTCSTSGTKYVPRPDRTDVVPGRNSTRNGTGTVSSCKCHVTVLLWVTEHAAAAAAAAAPPAGRPLHTATLLNCGTNKLHRFCCCELGHVVHSLFVYFMFYFVFQNKIHVEKCSWQLW